MMLLLHIPLPNLTFYAAITVMIVWALLHASEARQRERELRSATETLEGRIEGLLSLAGRNDQGPLSATTLRSQVQDLIGTHPSAEALGCVLAEPDVARDELAVQSWIAGAVHRRLGRLRSAVELNRTTAPTVGIMGTVTGMAIAISAYGANPDQGQLLIAIGLSLVKTLMAGFVTIIEGRTIERRLDPLQLELVLHSQTVVARARTYLAGTVARQVPVALSRPRTPPQPQRPAIETEAAAPVSGW